jgi:hypothetical protein
MTRKFHPSSYSGTKEALEAQARAADAGAKAAEAEATQKEGIPLILKVIIGVGVVNGLIYLFGDEDTLRGLFGRSQ